MLPDIKTGNAKTDGREFHCWFVGPIEKWCAENGIPFDANRFGIRNANDMEVKWGIYKKDDVRSVPAPSTSMPNI